MSSNEKIKGAGQWLFALVVIVLALLYVRQCCGRDYGAPASSVQATEDEEGDRSPVGSGVDGDGGGAPASRRETDGSGYAP